MLGPLVALECPSCDGKGGHKNGPRVPWHSCSECEGKGWVIGYVRGDAVVQS